MAEVEVKDPVVAEEPKVEEPKVEEHKEEEAAKAEAKDAAAEEEKAPEEPKELEVDAVGVPACPLEEGKAAFSKSDSTLNVMPIAGGSLLSALGEGGMSHLLAGVRANVGVKSGRYMFELRSVENLYPADGRQVIRVGFSTSGSSLFLADSDDYVCFDSEGFFNVGHSHVRSGRSFSRDVIAIVLNLDEASPNANTVSLFKKGRRVSKPQPLPESLKGKTLFPTVVYRNVTLEVNFGPEPLVPLPFKCHMVGAAGAADVDVVAESKSADGKFEVVYPVGLPEQGLFDWVDDFIQKNPSYTEISDRMIVEWAEKSGHRASKNQNGSNDKPNVSFGVPAMDDGSIRRLLAGWAPTLKRNLVVAELRSNLVPGDRAQSLRPFKARRFRTVAKVVMGEPTACYKDKVQKLILKQKEKKAEIVKRKKLEGLERKKKLAEKKKKQEEARKAKSGKTDSAETEEKDADAEVHEDETIEEMPPIEITEEEKALWYRKFPRKDMTEKDFSKSFTKFALPNAEEGFDQITYEWQPEGKCTEVLKKFLLDHKMTQKCDDIKPSAWFKEQTVAFSKSMKEWKAKASEWKNPESKKKLLQKKKDALKKDKPEGEEAEGEAAEPAELPEVNLDDIEPTDVEDITDIGSGEPLFSNFIFEDWALATIMFELHLLVHAFKKDLNDPERPTFPADHLSFYYNKYFNRKFELANYGFKEIEEFIDILKGTVTLEGDNKLFKAGFAEDSAPSFFVKLSEDHRRDRVRRVDAGDESAMLHFKKNALQSGGREREADGKGEGKNGRKGGKGDSHGKGRQEKGGRHEKGSEKGRWVREQPAHSSKGGGPRVGDASSSKRPWAAPPSRSGGGSWERAPAPARHGGKGGDRWAAQAEPAWKRPRTEDRGGGNRYGSGPVGGAGGYYRR